MKINILQGLRTRVRDRSRRKNIARMENFRLERGTEERILQGWRTKI